MAQDEPGNLAEKFQKVASTFTAWANKKFHDYKMLTLKKVSHNEQFSVSTSVQRRRIR